MGRFAATRKGPLDTLPCQPIRRGPPKCNVARQPLFQLSGGAVILIRRTVQCSGADAAVSRFRWTHTTSTVPTVYLPWSESITGFPRFLGPLPTPAPAVGRVPMHLPPQVNKLALACSAGAWSCSLIESREDSSLTHAIVSIVLPTKTNLATCRVFPFP